LFTNHIKGQYGVDNQAKVEVLSLGVAAIRFALKRLAQTHDILGREEQGN
jgi:hypothetical protein